MLTFFRRIRKGLLGEGATSKYLIYAIGEILLVMIGILLALQVNNWNEWRKDRTKEIAIMQSLEENLVSNKLRLERMIAQHEGEFRSSEIIISTIENRLPYHDSLDTHFAWALNVNSEADVLSYIGYEVMKNMGFDIISNDSLKKEIITLFENTYRGVENWNNRIGQSYDEIQKLKHERLMRKDGFRFVPFDFEKLREDKEFLSWLYSLKNNRAFINSRREVSLLRTESVLQLIKDELGE
jgi:hypothetical protein